MNFQILDGKQECFGIYTNGKFEYDRIPQNITGTWNWDNRFSDRNIDYAHIYCGGKTLSDVAPEALRPRFEKRQNKIRAFLKSAVNAKMNLDEVCMFDLVPEHHLRHYCEIKNEICEWVFENYEKPTNYSFFHEKLLYLSF